MKKQSVLSFLRNLTEAVEKDAEELEEKVRKICKEADEEEVEEAEDDEEEVEVEEAENDILRNQENYSDIDVVKEVFRRIRTDIDELDSGVYELFGDIVVPFDNLNDDGTLDAELDKATDELYDIASDAWFKLTKFFDTHKELMKKLGLNEAEEEEVEVAEDEEEDIELDVEESEDEEEEEEEVEETSKKAKVPTKVKESAKNKKIKAGINEAYKKKTIYEIEDLKDAYDSGLLDPNDEQVKRLGEDIVELLIFSCMDFYDKYAEFTVTDKSNSLLKYLDKCVVIHRNTMNEVYDWLKLNNLDHVTHGKGYNRMFHISDYADWDADEDDRYIVVLANKTDRKNLKDLD